MPSPLSGIKVLDFTRYQNGPHATLMLSDMGADVVKVEQPGDGDPGRALGRLPDGYCGYFEAFNRGKRSITVNLSSPEGLGIIHRLISKSDVITENFVPGAMERFGLGYDDVRKINPRIIYASNSGFGLNGEWAARPSYDIIAQAMSGAMIANAGGPASEPSIMTWGIADQVGAMVFAYSIMAAIVARERYGVGQYVHSSQLGAMISLQSFSIVPFLHTMVQAQRPPRGLSPTWTYYRAADGKWLVIGFPLQKWWPGVCDAVNRPDLITDERSAQPFARVENHAWVIAELDDAFAKGTRDGWLVRLAERDVPCAPVHTYAEVASDPQVLGNGYIVELDHPNFKGHRTVGLPMSLSETPPRIQGPASELGQHTEECLLELGYSWEEISTLRNAGAI